MSVAAALLSPLLLGLLSLLQLGVLAFALRRAPWAALHAVPQRLHLLFGALLALLFVWSITGQVGPHVSLHVLGMTTVTLLLGPSLAVVVGTAGVGLLALLGGIEPRTILANAVLTVSLPVAVTALLLQLALRHAPRNPFVYMLGVGFAGGALSMLAVLLVMLGLFALAGSGGTPREWAPPVLLLTMFPEGFINGALVSSLAVYKPHWLLTFDERHFLD